MGTDPTWKYVVEMTAQTDLPGLVHCLVRSLNSLSGTAEHRFYELRQQVHASPAQEGPHGGGWLFRDCLNDQDAWSPVLPESALNDCLQQRHMITLNDDEHHLEQRIFPVFDGEQHLYPVYEGEQITGILVQSRPNAGCATSDELARYFLLIYANLAAVFRKKDMDSLTGLLNRQTFDEHIGRISHSFTGKVHHHRQPGDGAALAVLDIDHFKQVNDVFGHLIGDEVLVLFTRLMKEVFRHNDFLFRFGGEEFIVVLVEVDRAKAHQALERFRQRVAEYAFPQVGRVTVSVGYVMVNEQDFPPVMMEKADQALYYAKNNGRNRVCSYDSLIKEGILARIDHTANEIELWDE